MWMVSYNFIRSVGPSIKSRKEQFWSARKGITKIVIEVEVEVER